MNTQYLSIAGIPAVLYGEGAKDVYLYLHGQGGCKEEAEAFAAQAGERGCQVLSIDLPEHGARKGQPTHLLPWNVVPELRQVMAYLTAHWDSVSLYAVSIGAWLGLLAFADTPLRQCLFVSPVLDMEALILGMMAAAGVSETRLEQEHTIPTDFGQTLSWEYLTYVRAHPITRWPHPTRILYAGRDTMTLRPTVDAFVSRFGCHLTVLDDGEHWFHTPEQLSVLRQWEKSSCKEAQM